MVADIDLDDPELYTNREISWLDFNTRVLAAAKRIDIPVLERLKFVAIAASNLDEFYMVRVAGLQRQLHGKYRGDPSGDRQRPAVVLAAVGRRAREAGDETSRTLNDSVLPALAKFGIRFLDIGALTNEQQKQVTAYYRREVHPCLTPIAIDPAHPFPHLRNLSLNLALRISQQRQMKAKLYAQPEGTRVALVQVPSMLPRFVPIETNPGERAFMPLETIIAMHASELFPGHDIIEAKPFRVTRASDLDIAEEDAENLLDEIAVGLRRRDRGHAVRVEFTSGTSEELTELLCDMLDIELRHVHTHDGFIVTAALMALCRIGPSELMFRPHTPVLYEPLRLDPAGFRTISERDVLLHHPYESFGHIVDFLNRAADDPDVVAIKQTLYRTSGDSPFARALARAAANGKQVTALVELKARFDEAANIQWARELEESGVHVVYGLLGLKTHCKLLLVIRHEGDDLKRYLHVATGNYNSTTARLYTDLSLFTAREDITADAMLLFNVLTGYAEHPKMQQLIVSPFEMRESLMGHIEREIAHARAGRPARIIAKMNSLVDPDVIRALYRASQAGVRTDLLIRGICCLRPGVPGVSENITVRAIIDRFLEHARISWFANGGEEEVYLSSADWMPRNLNRRIEITFPVLDPAIARRIRDEVLAVEMEDTASSWTLDPDGVYRVNVPAEGTAAARAQARFIELAKQRRARAPTRVRREFSSRDLRVSPALQAVVSRRRRTENR